MKTIWQALKSNILFLITYRRNMRQLREEERDLDMERQLLEFEMWMTLHTAKKERMASNAH